MKNQSLLISIALLTTLSLSTYIKPSQADMTMDSTQMEVIETIGDTSANSLDWNGVYQGIVPCASCEGIKTTLTLNEDLSFVMSRQYLGKSEEVFEIKGTFKWNEAGNTISLDGIKDAPNQFLVGENILFQLDMEGNRITGDLAEKYMLTKVEEAQSGETTETMDKSENSEDEEKTENMENSESQEVSLINTRWELVEIMGKPVTKTENQRQAIFMMFSNTDDNNRVNGFGGCNNFMGGFEMKEGNRINFEQMASTMMACENIEMETTFMETLQQIDNYTMKDNVLSLNRAKMAPLLKFTAIADK
ncbi:copper resistance protein NlpE N-terminal domain-containing protein [Geminocystis sp. NIES-3709]|uniref:copper resistance protein NlpE N-terminal domain-containing protein n=1 Tax=Geminocystis sp. NIES-3709 TaxID=1617448 RepID=UPI0005FC6025|nr:copper resistance protein NlpE N-terminal domain-containing protein [Geminocystis sp. NIES-3709]BAQ66497.1 lipoprotein [Geminocystis sp. NIES-3709]